MELSELTNSLGIDHTVLLFPAMSGTPEWMLLIELVTAHIEVGVGAQWETFRGNIQIMTGQALHVKPTFQQACRYPEGLPCSRARKT